MTKTPEQLAAEHVKKLWQDSGTEFERMACECDFLAGYQAAMNSPKKLDSWISVKDRLPDSQDGITQVWLRKSSWIEEGHICPFVLGYHAMMYTIDENDKDGIEGICDIHKPGGVWEISDFTHWMPFPKMPEGWR